MDLRVRLRPWLQSRLDQGYIDGLGWLDKDKGIFKIPWKHHSKHTWTEADAAIFKDWAVVTGRYREGIDDPDWPMWKTRLRCALNKAPDIQEVKQRHDLHCEEPFKVYRFISKTEAMWRANATRNASFMFDGIPPDLHPTFSSLPELVSQNYGPRVITLKRPSYQMQRIPGVENKHALSILHKQSDGVFVKQLPIMHTGLPIASNLPLESSPQIYPPTQQFLNPFVYNPIASSLDYSSSDSSVNKGNFWRFWSSSPSVWTGIPHPSVVPDISEPELHQLGVRIQHLDVRVRDTVVTNPNGCCIFFGRYDEISHPAAPDPVQVQIPHHISQANKEYVDLLLDNMVRGVLLSVVRGNIFAERICKCAVFVYIPAEDGNYILFKKLGRRTRELVFDYKDFLTEFRHYRQGHRPKPSFEFILSFGQQLRPSFDTGSLLVWCRIACCRAWFRFHENSLSFSHDEDEGHDKGLISASGYNLVTAQHACGSNVSGLVMSATNGLMVSTGQEIKRRKLDDDDHSVWMANLSDPTSSMLVHEELVATGDQDDVIEEAVEVPLDCVVDDGAIDDQEVHFYRLSTHTLPENLVLSDDNSTPDPSAPPLSDHVPFLSKPPYLDGGTTAIQSDGT